MSDVILDDEGNEIVETEVVVDQVEGDEGTSDEDERTVSSSDSDSEMDGAEDESEREAIRARRRDERKHRKEAQREREDTLRRELASRDVVINELRTKMDSFERRSSGSDMAQLENAKKQTAQAYNYYKDQIRVATEAGNGAAVAEATERLIQSQRKFDELSSYERSMKQRQAQPQPLDPRIISNAQRWQERNNWFDAGGKDPDSRIIMTLDQQLAEEGWDATTPQYWEELDVRTKKYLPHRQQRATSNTNKPRSVVTGSGREASSAQPSKGYKLSSERIQAIKDAGSWDDLKARAEMVARYREYDKQNQG